MRTVRDPEAIRWKIAARASPEIVALAVLIAAIVLLLLLGFGPSDGSTGPSPSPNADAWVPYWAIGLACARSTSAANAASGAGDPAG